jgi:hypothetical protein
MAFPQLLTRIGRRVLSRPASVPRNLELTADEYYGLLGIHDGIHLRRVAHDIGNGLRREGIRAVVVAVEGSTFNKEYRENFAQTTGATLRPGYLHMVARVVPEALPEGRNPIKTFRSEVNKVLAAQSSQWAEKIGFRGYNEQEVVPQGFSVADVNIDEIPFAMAYEGCQEGVYCFDLQFAHGRNLFLNLGRSIEQATASEYISQQREREEPFCVIYRRGKLYFD